MDMSDQFHFIHAENCQYQHDRKVGGSHKCPGQGGEDRIHNPAWNSALANKPLNGLACLR
jgi:hypothetical protein